MNNRMRRRLGRRYELIALWYSGGWPAVRRAGRADEFLQLLRDDSFVCALHDICYTVGAEMSPLRSRIADELAPLSNSELRDEIAAERQAIGLYRE